MSAEIFRFPGAPAPGTPTDPVLAPSEQLVRMLRWYADEIEAGRLTPRSALIVFHHGEHLLPDVIGGGVELNRLEVAGVLAQAALKAQAVAFRGAHVSP